MWTQDITVQWEYAPGCFPRAQHNSTPVERDWTGIVLLSLTGHSDHSTRAHCTLGQYLQLPHSDHWWSGCQRSTFGDSVSVAGPWIQAHCLVGNHHGSKGVWQASLLSYLHQQLPAVAFIHAHSMARGPLSASGPHQYSTNPVVALMPDSAWSIVCKTSMAYIMYHDLTIPIEGPNNLDDSNSTTMMTPSHAPSLPAAEVWWRKRLW